MTFIINNIHIEEFSRCKFDSEGLDGLFFQLAMVVLGFHLTTTVLVVELLRFQTSEAWQHSQIS